MTNIMLVDDHKLVRQGIRKLLETEPDFEVIGEAGNGYEAVATLTELHPDILITDLSMPGMNGIEVTRRVKSSLPGINIIILSMYGDESYVIEALDAGATGYVLKDSDLGDLANAVREAANGGCYLSPPLSLNKLSEYRRRTRHTVPQPEEKTTAN